MYLFFYNKNHKIAVKFNNNTLAKKIKKQVSKKFAHEIDTYFIKSNIITTKLCMIQILSSRDIVIEKTHRKRLKS